MKFIIDTDIGDDIDDAFALDCALKNEIELECVTTVFRNTVERAQIAKKLIALFGREIPVYAGYGDTLSGKEKTDGRLCQWTEDLARYTPESVEPEDAVDAIINAARKYQGELKILALGPLTNIARALKKDGAAMQKIGGIVMMGGDFARHYASWNVRCDVAAAERVLSSGLYIVAFGAELTSSARLTRAQQEYVFSMNRDAYHACLAQLSRLWYASKREGTLIELHAALVVRYAKDPFFCKTRHALVAVETEGRYAAGMTLDLSRMETVSREAGCPLQIAREFDVSRFLHEFMESIGYKAE